MFNKKDNEFQKIAAYHEAGHAALLIAFGKKFDFITIIPDEKNKAYVEFGHEEIRGLLDFVGSLESILAGGVAEMILQRLPSLDPIMESGHMGDDLRQFDALIHQNSATICKEEGREFGAWIFRRTYIHMQQRWPVVTRIAEQLQRKKKLTYDECRALMS